MNELLWFCFYQVFFGGGLIYVDKQKIEEDYVCKLLIIDYFAYSSMLHNAFRYYFSVKC